MQITNIKKALGSILRRLLGETAINHIATVYRTQRLKKGYSRGAKYEQVLIYMADGKQRHGGLADRLKGMATCYQYCKERGLPFKINHTSPFDLTRFLVPNRYDWTIAGDKISYNSRVAVPVYVRQQGGNIGDRAYGQLIRKLSKYHQPQVHVYTGGGYRMELFQQNFNELFMPSPFLAEALKPHREALAGSYVSISFRFQSLLGDFLESGCRTLGEAESGLLLEKCLAAICRIRQSHPEVEKLLVTSDSDRFRHIVTQAYADAYIVPGEMGHTDYGGGGQLPAFLDFFLIAGARKAYRVRNPLMYKSDFAHCASRVNGKPFESIELM
jgi:hypothetical protein